MRFFLILILSCGCFTLFSQSEEKFEQLLKDFQVHQDSLSLSMKYADSLELMADKKNDPLWQVRAAYVKGFLYRTHDQFTEALIHYQRALNLSRTHGFRDREAMTLNGLGMTYNLLGRYPEALRNLFLSLQIRNEMEQDQASLAIVLNNIGLVYYSLGDYTEAENYFRKSYESDSVQLLKLINLGLVALEEGKNELAKNYFYQFKRQNSDTLNSLYQEYLIGLGLYFKKRENYDSAIYYFGQSVAIGNTKLQDYQLAMSLYDMAAVNYDRKEYRVADSIARQSIELSKQLNAKKLVLQNMLLLAKANTRLKKYDEATKYFLLQDSLERVTQDAEMFREVYNLEIDEIEESYRKMLNQKEALLASERQAKLLYLIITAVLAVLGLVLYRIKRTKEKMLRQLTFAQDQLVEREKMAALGRMMAGIAHELNTPLGGLNGLLKQFSKRFDSVHSLIDEADHSGHQAKIMDELALKVPDNSDFALTTREKRTIKRSLTSLHSSLPPDTIECLADLGISCLSDEEVKWLKDVKGASRFMIFYHLQVIRRNTGFMEHALSRMATVVSAMQSYSRPGQADKLYQVVDLKDNMEVVLVLMQNYLKRGTDVTLELPDEPVPVIGDRDRLAQVWTNLIMNSLQAMNFSGKLNIRMILKEEEVLVEIEDNGPGIPDEIQRHVFEAFFTTKHTIAGTGLGLSIVQSIVKEHKGQISFTSKPGSTRFHIVFPTTNDVN